MSPHRNSKRPAPDAYDHLWLLLPVFVAFFAMILLVAAADDRPVVDYAHTAAAPMTQHSADPSVPSADEAMAKLPNVVAEPVATY